MTNIAVQCEKDSLFNKGHWINWIFTREKKESGPQPHTSYTKINPRCTADLNVKGKTV